MYLFIALAYESPDNCVIPYIQGNDSPLKGDPEHATHCVQFNISHGTQTMQSTTDDVGPRGPNYFRTYTSVTATVYCKCT